MPDVGVPKGKISCLLCRGFVGYKHSDRTRFQSHMETEHEARYDWDLVLAVSVLAGGEREVLLRAVLPRLGEIGRGVLPSAGPLVIRSGEAIKQQEIEDEDDKQSETESVGGAARARGGGVARGRGGNRGRGGRGGGSVSVGRMAQPPRPPPKVVQPPTSLRGNTSINISVVDQRVECITCHNVFPNRDVMAEHVRTNHLTRFGGLTIGTAVEGKQKPRAPSPLNLPTRERPGLAYVPPQKITPSLPRQNPTPIPIHFGNNIQRSSFESSIMNTESRLRSPIRDVAPVPSPSAPVDHMIKCSTCAQLVRRSLFKDHKETHNLADAQEEQLKDLVQLADSDSEESGQEIDKPHIPCNKCGKLLASNIALRMHINLKHPVKDTEELLTEERDLAMDEQIKMEVESMGTLDLLDNLVSFLSDS